MTCTFDGPVRLVFDAWTKPELFKLLWWAPKSRGVPLFSCEMVVRIGGSYRIAFGDDPSNAMAFFGKYLEVSSPSRLVWTNDESDEGAVTTVTFEKDNDRTLLVSSIPRRKRSTRRSLAWRIRCLNNSRSWMSFHLAWRKRLRARFKIGQNGRQGRLSQIRDLRQLDFRIRGRNSRPT